MRFSSLQLSLLPHWLSLQEFTLAFSREWRAAGCGGQSEQLFNRPRRGTRRHRCSACAAHQAPQRAGFRDGRGQALRRDLGNDDQKLDEYLHAVRDVEQRACSTDAWLDIPEAVVDPNSPPFQRDVPKAQAANIGAPRSTMALALRTDMTRRHHLHERQRRHGYRHSRDWHHAGPPQPSPPQRRPRRAGPLAKLRLHHAAVRDFLDQLKHYRRWRRAPS